MADIEAVCKLKESSSPEDWEKKARKHEKSFRRMMFRAAWFEKIASEIDCWVIEKLKSKLIFDIQLGEIENNIKSIIWFANNHKLIK